MLFDSFTGKIRQPKRTITETQDHIIYIGEWQNQLGKFGDLPIRIYHYGEIGIFGSNLILNLAEEIKDFKLMHTNKEEWAEKNFTIKAKARLRPRAIFYFLVFIVLAIMTYLVIRGAK